MSLKNSKDLPDRFLSVLGFEIGLGKVEGEEEDHEKKNGFENPSGEKPYFFVP
jgi:hypothetical protein